MFDLINEIMTYGYLFALIWAALQIFDLIFDMSAKGSKQKQYLRERETLIEYEEDLKNSKEDIQIHEVVDNTVKETNEK